MNHSQHTVQVNATESAMHKAVTIDYMTGNGIKSHTFEGIVKALNFVHKCIKQDIEITRIYTRE